MITCTRWDCLEQLKGDEIPTSRKIWEAIQALFAAMNEVQENVVSRFGSKTKVVFTTSPGYANMPPALAVRVRGLDPDSRRE